MISLFFVLKLNNIFINTNMWYKYLDRSVDTCRIWRRANLRFNQDDNGSLKSKKPWAISEYLYRAVRSEGPLRGSLLFILFGALNIYMWSAAQKEKIEGPIKKAKEKQINDQKDKVAKEKLWYNRFGAPSRPLRSVEDFMIFIASQGTLSKATDYIGYEGTINAYEDYQKGLDGIASQEDKKMLDYYRQSLKFKSHH